METTNFSEHPMGSSTNVPASTQKKLIERFTLGEDGKSLMVSGTVEDPLYLAQPGQWTGQLEYVPACRTRTRSATSRSRADSSPTDCGRVARIRVGHRADRIRCLKNARTPITDLWQDTQVNLRQLD